MLNIISYNLAHRTDAWNYLRETGADIALLQEACPPPADLTDALKHDPAPWRTGSGARPWRTCVARLNEKIELRHHESRPLEHANYGDLPASVSGTIAAADVTDPDAGGKITVVSMYAKWEKSHATHQRAWIYADAAVHRLISDLSVFFGWSGDLPIIAAGDLNILYGYGDNGSAYWARRYQTIFDRFEALGLRFVGPQYPNGRKAGGSPKELPPDSLNVPTFYPTRGKPATATRQLDFVFASESIADRVSVRALNECDAWGPSDHCRVEIVVKD